MVASSDELMLHFAEQYKRKLNRFDFDKHIFYVIFRHIAKRNNSGQIVLFDLNYFNFIYFHTFCMLNNSILSLWHHYFGKFKLFETPLSNGH